MSIEIENDCNHGDFYVVCVHGNIGAGKSTFIEKQRDFVRLPEPVTQWGDTLDKYYRAIAKKPGTLSDSDQNDIIKFEKLITEIRLKQYEELLPGKKYIFERSIKESWVVFCQNLREYLDEEHWCQLEKYFCDAIKKEPKFTKEIYLKADIETLMKRIEQRGRAEEIGLSKVYLMQIQKNEDVYFGELPDCLA